MLLPEPFVTVFLPIFALLLGCCVGSFLNVVIYRLPNGLGVNEPKRSFCPTCKYGIPWYQNLPILSWLLLRGKCASCGNSIAPRYLMVEALTGICFLAIWKAFAVDYTTVSETLGSLPSEQRTVLALLKAMAPSAGVVLAMWILFSLLIAATFIDFDHFIIPDSITLGGLVVGVLAATVMPWLLDEAVWYRGLMMSLIGAATGYALLWVVVNLGKLAFGRLRYEFKEPAPFGVHQPDDADEPLIHVDGEDTGWTDVFYRPTDRMVVDLTELEIDGETRETGQMLVYGDRFELPDGATIDLGDVKKITGRCSKIVIPREAMGFGDVKFIAMIGAFLGWKAVLFTVFAASIVGAVVGITQKLVSREEWKRPIPFGPYLTFGAVLWVFAGPVLTAWYFGLLGFGG